MTPSQEQVQMSVRVPMSDPTLKGQLPEQIAQRIGRANFVNEFSGDTPEKAKEDPEQAWGVDDWLEAMVDNVRFVFANLTTADLLALLAERISDEEREVLKLKVRGVLKGHPMMSTIDADFAAHKVLATLLSGEKG